MCDDSRCQYLLDTADINWSVHTRNAIFTLEACKADLTQTNAGRQPRSEREGVNSAVEVEQNPLFLKLWCILQDFFVVLEFGHKCA